MATASRRRWPRPAHRLKPSLPPRQLQPVQSAADDENIRSRDPHRSGGDPRAVGVRPGVHVNVSRRGGGAAKDAVFHTGGVSLPHRSRRRAASRLRSAHRQRHGRRRHRRRCPARRRRHQGWTHRCHRTPRADGRTAAARRGRPRRGPRLHRRPHARGRHLGIAHGGQLRAHGRDVDRRRKLRRVRARHRGGAPARGRRPRLGELRHAHRAQHRPPRRDGHRESRSQRHRAGEDEGARLEGDGRRRRRLLDRAPVRPGDVLEDARDHRAGARRGERRRSLRVAHAQRRDGARGIGRRSDPHRIRDRRPGADLASESRQPEPLGGEREGVGAHRRGTQTRCRRRSGPVCVHRRQLDARHPFPLVGTRGRTAENPRTPRRPGDLGKGEGRDARAARRARPEGSVVRAHRLVPREPRAERTLDRGGGRAAQGRRDGRRAARNRARHDARRRCFDGLSLHVRR